MISGDLESYLVPESDYVKPDKAIGGNRLGQVFCCTKKNKQPGQFAVRYVTGGSTGPDFMREIDVFMKLRPHPAVCTFYGYNFSPQITVCEYLPNGTLQDLFTSAQNRRPDPHWDGTLKSKIVFGFAAAMCHLHSIGAVHRYLSPNNIMFDADWNPKLVDFGYARIITADSAQMSMRQSDKTLEYMAQELLEGTEFTADADVYSYAIILAQICSDGAPLYPKCTTPASLQRAVCAGGRPAIAPGTCVVLDKMMQKAWHASIDQRPAFPHIVRRLLEYDEPLFPGTDMTAYRAYRDRVFAATSAHPDYAEVFYGSSVRPEDVPEFQDALARAEAGDAEYQLRVGAKFERGIGTQVDHERAFHFYLASAQKGNSLAKLNVGICFLTGTGTDPSNADAMRWLEEAATDPGLPFARYCFSSLLFRGSREAAQRQRGFDLLKAAADPPFSIPEAQYDLAVAYDTKNDIVPIDFAKAREYYDRAARNGIDGAYIDLATMDLEGRGGARNIPNALRTLEQAAVKKMPMALCNLGDIYGGPKYGLEDQDKALEYYTRAAELKDPFASLKLAVFLRKKALAEPANAGQLNRESALYMEQAAIGGNTIALTNYGKFLLDGIGVPVNVPEAKRFLTIAASKGVNAARVLLGDIWAEGRGGTTPDVEQARMLWRDAADAGYASAGGRLAKLAGP